MLKYSSTDWQSAHHRMPCCRSVISATVIVAGAPGDGPIDGSALLGIAGAMACEGCGLPLPSGLIMPMMPAEA
jgi:hypothetical protein